MKGKILFLAGLGLGYVLGTRDGRERYEQLKGAVRSFWSDPRVQRQVDGVGSFVKSNAPEFAEFVSDSAKKVASQVSGNKTPSPKKPAPKASTRTSSTGGASRASGS